MTSFPHSHTITLIGRVKEGTDDYGDDAWVDVQTVTSGVFDPGGSTETSMTGDMIVTQPTVYDVRLDLDVTPFDAVIVDGQRYEVDGRPVKYRSPFTNWQPGWVIRLRGATG